MTNLKIRVSNVVKTLAVEFRVPVINAANVCDGTIESFTSEMQSQVWDCPELPVDDIVGRIVA
jgi:hypothetical protein